MAIQKRALVAEDLYQLISHSDPQVSPDGTAYMFVSTQINGDHKYESHLFFHRFSEKEPMQWTFGDKKNSHHRFSPDGNKLVFQSNRSGTSQIYVSSTSGGEPEQITFFKYGADSPHWSKDGKKIIFTALLEQDADVQNQKEQTEEERKKENEAKKERPIIVQDLKYKSDAAGLFDNKGRHLVLYDMSNETFIKLTNDHVNHTFEDISPDGNYIVFSANLNEDADFEHTIDLYMLHLETKEIEIVTDGNGVYGNALFSPCGNKLACFGHRFEYLSATLTDLFVIDLNQSKLICLSKEWDLELGDALIGDTRIGESTVGPVWDNDGKRLFFISTDKGATALYEVDLDANLSMLYENNNHIFSFSYNKQDDSFVLGISSPTNPGEFYLLQNDKRLKQLTYTNEAFLNEVSLAEPEELTIQSTDSIEVQGWLLRPHNFQADKKYPLILEIHGGPHAMYGQTFFHEMQLLAAKGYVVLYTNPRGSHGYGQKFVNAVREDYGGGDYTDLMKAVDYVLEHFSFIDGHRLGVTGGSYGGFMTNWIVGKTNRFKAAVTQRSISNWLSMYGVSDIGYFFTKWELGYRVDENPEKLWDYSPLKYVNNIETPLLILHGEQDLRCPIEQAEQLFITLKQMRKEVEFIRFPHANHELSRSGKPKLRIERLKHICRWFDKYL